MSEPLTKQCPGCNKVLSINAFFIYQYSGKTRRLCRACCAEQRRKSRAKQREAGTSRTNEQGLKLVPPVHVEESVREENTQRRVHLRPYATVVALGDIHFPFHHEGALNQALALIKEVRPEYVVQMGDLYDLYSFSKYPRSYNVMTPQDELLQARGFAEEMWAKVKELAPAAHCFQLWGNHDSRAMRRTIERLPEAEGFVARGMRDMMTFPGVTLIDDQATELVIDGVHYVHSHVSRVGQTMQETGKSCVTAHLHVGGFVSKGYEGAITWELGVGWLGNRRAPCFSYASRKRAHKTTLGIGIVDSLGPRFVPFEEE